MGSASNYSNPLVTGCLFQGNDTDCESGAIILLYIGYVCVVVCSRTVSYENDSGDESGAPLFAAAPSAPRGLRSPLDWARRRPAEVELASPSEVPRIPPVRRGSDAASMWDQDQTEDDDRQGLLGGTSDEDTLTLRGVS